MKTRMIALAAAALALAALTLLGCARNGQTPCRLAEEDPSRFVCDGREYAILDETVPDDDLGAWKGNLRAIVAFDRDGREVARMDALAFLADLDAFAERAPDAVGTRSFAGVFERRGHEGELAVEVDGRNRRAVPGDAPPEGAAVLAFAPPSDDAAPDGGFAIDPSNARRLVSGAAVFEVTDERVDEARIGALLDAVPKSATFDADTLRPLARDELLALDLTGEQDQRRETVTYSEIWTLADTPAGEAVAVKVGDAFLLARRIQRDGL